MIVGLLSVLPLLCLLRFDVVRPVLFLNHGKSQLLNLAGCRHLSGSGLLPLHATCLYHGFETLHLPRHLRPWAHVTRHLPRHLHRTSGPRPQRGMCHGRTSLLCSCGFEPGTAWLIIEGLLFAFVGASFVGDACVGFSVLLYLVFGVCGLGFWFWFWFLRAIAQSSLPKVPCPRFIAQSQLPNIYIYIYISAD